MFVYTQHALACVKPKLSTNNYDTSRPIDWRVESALV